MTTINLAHSIPADQVRNAGEPVFPVLRTWLANYGAAELLPFVDDRESYGVNKYGQTLMTGDGRHTPTEIVTELLDALAYGTKAMMTHSLHREQIESAMIATLEASLAWLDVIDWLKEPPWSQADLNSADTRSAKLGELLGSDTVKFWPGGTCPQCNNPTSFVSHDDKGKCTACGHEKGNG